MITLRADANYSTELSRFFVSCKKECWLSVEVKIGRPSSLIFIPAADSGVFIEARI